MPHPSHSLTLEQCVNLFDSSDSFDDIFFIFFIKFAFYAEKKCNMFFKSAMLKKKIGHNFKDHIHNVNVFGLGGIDLLRCCCKYNIYGISPHKCSLHDHPIADLYRWSWGRWRVSEASTSMYLNVEQRAHWLLILERTNQLCRVVMMSLCQIVLDYWTVSSRVSYQNLVFNFDI